MPDRYGESDEAFAVAECGLCDDRGIRRGFACDHVDWAGAAARGMAMIRTAMGWDRPKGPPSEETNRSDRTG